MSARAGARAPESLLEEGPESFGRLEEGLAVALPERSGKVAGGFGRVPVRFREVRGVPGGGKLRDADFRSLKR